MIELKYNMDSDGLKRLANIRIHKDEHIRKSLRNRWFILDLLVLLMIFALSRKENFNLVESIAFILALFIIANLIIAIIVWLSYKSIVRSFVKRLESNLNNSAVIKMDNAKVSISRGSTKYEYSIQDSKLLDTDDFYVYILFANSMMTYIPKSAFKNKNQISEFMEMLEK